MARGAEAKLRRRNNRKQAAEEADDPFDESSEPVPLSEAIAPVDDLPKQKKKKKKKPADAANGSDGEPLPTIPSAPGSKGIKTTPLILLILMVGTTVLPALIYAGDFLSAYLSKNSGSIGYSLGLGAVPKKRVISFYEKHAPEKVESVPTILSNHYGDYPKLIKKLERKYQDYGYFMGWEEDEAPLRLVKEQLTDLYDMWLQQYWNRYAPQALKTAFRNVRYNITFLGKKGRRLWKKHVWPLLEPIIGVPDGGEKQKRKDAAEARKRAGQKTSGSARRRNRDFRDDEEE